MISGRKSDLWPLGKEDFSLARLRKALPLMLLLWLACLLSTQVVLGIARQRYQAAERQITAELLDTFIASLHLDSHARPAPQNLYSSALLPGLDFVRLTRGGRQLVLARDGLADDELQTLLSSHLDRESGLFQPQLEGKIWTLVNQQTEHGLNFLAGRDSSSAMTDYRLFRARSLWFSVLVAAAMVFLALLLVRQALQPLVRTGELIDGLADKNGSLLPEQGNGPELDSLHQQINGLLRQNRRLVNEMQLSLDNVAHDLRTPMTRLRSVAEYGLQAVDDPERLREALSDCLEESERVLAMLRIMMSVAEAESGTMRLERQKVSLQESLSQVVSLYEYVAEDKEIKVRLEMAEEAAVFVDPTRISQVWANLLDNAIKYGKKGGWVTILVGTEEERVRVDFLDNGMGISRSELPRIWERLFRGDRSRSERGLGLGLNFVKAVVEAHGGTVSVTSSLQEGSCFSVFLPSYRQTELR